MIVYFDTSAIVKLYIDELGTPIVQGILNDSEAVAVSTVAYAETRSAFGRAQRAGTLSSEAHETAKNTFETDWEGFAAVPAIDTICRHAGELAERHALRGFDAVHLASAIHVRDRDNLKSIAFLTWDVRLGQAAAVEGLEVLGV